MSVIILKKDFNTKFKLSELLKDKCRIRESTNLPSDILVVDTNQKFFRVSNEHDLEGLDLSNSDKTQCYILVQMISPNISSISLKCTQKRVKMVLFLDRFDLCNCIIATITSKTHNIAPIISDELKLISLMTWKRSPLPRADCEIVLSHFKTLKEMVQIDKEALKFSLNALPIQESYKHHIFAFLTSNEDHLIE